MIRKSRASNQRGRAGCLVGAIVLIALSGCGILTDAATRIAYDLEAGVARLGSQNGASYTVHHQPRRGQCDGPYTVQFDKVGALIVWCKNASGETVSSPGTSYHRRFVDTEKTFIVDKSAGETLLIRLERRAGRALITEVL